MTFRIVAGICKAKDLLLAIALAWHGIGGVWQFDETDVELIGRN